MKNKFLNFSSFFIPLTFIVYFGVSFLILDEQLKRGGMTPLVAILISIFVLSSFFLLIRAVKKVEMDTEIKSLDAKNDNKIVFIFSLFLFVVVLTLAVFPIIVGKIGFELSADSTLYHLPIIHSLSSIFSPYGIGKELVVYVETFPRAAEALSALMRVIFSFLTPLQSQTWIFSVLMIVSFVRVSRLIGALESLTMHVLIVCTPTVLLQMSTNYIDIIPIPLFLIGISTLLLAKYKYEFLMGVFWIGLLAGVKLTLVPIGLILVVLILLFKKGNFSWRYWLLFFVVVLLPVLPVLILNYVIYKTPAAPYGMFIWNGWDAMKTNFLTNRPEEFKIGVLWHSGIARFLYSHFAKAFIPFPVYDARLGGGGIIFPFLLVLYLIGTMRSLIKWLIDHVIKGHLVITKITLGLNSVFYIIILAGLFLIPETYWFRYIIVIFIAIVLHTFIIISGLEKKSKVIILSFLIVLALTQVFTLRVNLIKGMGLEPNGENLLEAPSYSPNLNESLTTLLALKSKIKDKKNILYIMEKDTFSGLGGNYVAALSPFATANYVHEGSVDIDNAIKSYDVVFYMGENLDNFYEKFKNKYSIYYIKDPVQSDAVILLRST